MKRLASCLLLPFALAACDELFTGPEAAAGIALNEETIRDYSCDVGFAWANSARTVPLAGMRAFPAFPSNPIYQTHSVQIAGTLYQLKSLTVLPVGTPPNGLVILNHGLGADYTTRTLDTGTRFPDEYEWLRRGYAVLYIARRGAMGSTGAMVGNDVGYTQEDYTSQRVGATAYGIAHIDYQSMSVVAVLAQIANDPRFTPYLHSILMMGASGGAFTSIYAARQSSVFQAATRRAVVRITGSNSWAYIDNELALASSNEAESYRAWDVGVPTLWIAGENDTTSHPGQLACGAAYFGLASGRADRFYLVPGMGHGGWWELWSDTLFPYFANYLRGQGFATF